MPVVNWKRSFRRLFALFVERQTLTSLGSISPTSGAVRSERLVADSSRNPLLETKPYPLNAPGPFYSVDEGCIICGAPHAAAPELMAWYEGPAGNECRTHCFFRRQPETRQELESAITAMEVSCVDNLRYGGDDPIILETLCDRGLRHLCDVFEK
jgi:hypothetical protein